MGLDLTLGAMVLIAAIRGYFRGFVLQAIRLGALVGCVYLADPVRDLARPFAAKQVATIEPELLDRLLWWASAAVSYVVTAGLATWVVRASRRRRMIHPLMEPESDRGDQGAGFLLGGLKGGVVAAFLASAIVQYGAPEVESVPWAAEQFETSKALAWSRQYRPAERIWTSAPVQSFVAEIRRNGLWSDDAGDDEPRRPTRSQAERPVQTASRPRTLTLPRAVDEARRLDPGSPGFLHDLDRLFHREGIDKPR